jgi:sialate O-acetylesterase
MVGQKAGLAATRAVDEPLSRFQICGADRKWQWAQAKMTGKYSVEVWHPAIPVPVEVRYAWSANPEGANLYNQEGLPASLFKTK